MGVGSRALGKVIMKAFISYSHKDATHLERLHVHLAALRREGKIVAWHDRKILAGDNIDKEVDRNLGDSDLFLALVSPDFIASNYCHDIEMQEAIARHEAGKMRLIPIIVEPCDWQSTPLGRFKAIPHDGKPVSEWQNQNSAFVSIVMALRNIVADETTGIAVPLVSISTPIANPPASTDRRYRVKRDFDAIDKNDFRDQAYKAIRDYIQASIAEIDGVENIRARFMDINACGFTCTILNRLRGQSVGHITVYAKTGSMGMWDIYYSSTENAPPNTANGGFNIGTDDYELYLSADSFVHTQRGQDRLTPLQAAQIIWDKLLEQVGISHA